MKALCTDREEKLCKYNSRTWEIAQCLSQKCEDQISHLQNHVEVEWPWWLLVITTLGDRESPGQAGLLDSLELVSFGVSERTCLKKQGGDGLRKIPEINFGPSHAYTHMCIPVHTYTYIHAKNTFEYTLTSHTCAHQNDE